MPPQLISLGLRPSTSAYLRYAAVGTVLCLLYIVTARFHMRYNPSLFGPVTIWLPSGIALVGCLLLGVRALPLVTLACTLTYVSILPAGAQRPIGVEDLAHLTAVVGVATLQAWLAYRLWQRFIPNGLDSFGSTLRFVGLVAILPYLITTPLTFTHLLWGGYLDTLSLAARFMLVGIVSLANILGMILVVPLYQAWADSGWPSRRELTMIGLGIPTLLIIQFVAFRSDPALIFITIPILLLVSLTSGPWAAAVATLLLSVASVGVISRQAGPLVTPEDGATYLPLLVYLLVLSISSLLGRAQYNQVRGHERQLGHLVEQRTAQLRHEMSARTVMAEEMAYHALLFEHISDAIVAVDADMIVRDWNRAAERIYGYQAGEVIGRSLLQVARTQTPLSEDASMLADLHAAGFWLGEVTHLHKDGHPIPMYSSVSVVRDAVGQITGYVAVNRDMTEQRRAQQAVEDERALLAQRVEERTLELRAANRQLVHAAKAKDEFLASMSHELRTPLNAVLVLSEIIDTEAAGPVTAQQRKYLKNIQESGQHLLGLINDVLDLSKIEAGMLSVDCGPVAVTDLCTASIGLIAGQAQAKQITYSISVDSEVRLIQADGRRTKQILVNLLSNAVKFTPAQGQVGLIVAGDRTGALVRFTVWDTGIGIAPEQMVQLFEPFVQLDSSLTRRYEGSGLGLPLAIRLAHLQGGNIEVESEVGKGSRFTLSLPWTPSMPSNAVTSIPKTAERRGRNAVNKGCVLLVDDTPAFLHAARDYLLLRGFDVATASSGSEALALSRARRPDLILMDIQMPELDGLATTHLLRQDPELSTIPVVALTALAMPGDYERCLEAGMVDYFTKPISLQRLYDVVADYMPRPSTEG